MLEQRHYLYHFRSQKVIWMEGHLKLRLLSLYVFVRVIYKSGIEILSLKCNNVLLFVLYFRPCSILRNTIYVICIYIFYDFFFIHKISQINQNLHCVLLLCPMLHDISKSFKHLYIFTLSLLGYFKPRIR